MFPVLSRKASTPRNQQRGEGNSSLQIGLNGGLPRPVLPRPTSTPDLFLWRVIWVGLLGPRNGQEVQTLEPVGQDFPDIL